MPGIFITPCFHVNAVLRSRQQCAATDPIAWRTLCDLALHPLHEIVQNPTGHQSSFAGINKTEKDQVAEQDLPVCSKTPEQSTPVQFRAARTHQVRNVRAVVALPFHDEALGPDQLFGWAQLYRGSENFAWHRMVKPIVIDFAEPISRIENNIADVIASENFPQPMRETQLRAIS